jgi:AraC-like DNA-binding protein
MLSDLAASCDVSHFNRAFRRRLGETPSGVRAAAIAPDQK